ncbi:MAG TPA: glycosyltransferase [Ktedonobacteraceae bacterium]|nr:glycosyltransferase [Chthonomonadales bacterium]HEV2583857.1 glycosyltransferase [Ktedonobacteraceae bacterium]
MMRIALVAPLVSPIVQPFLGGSQALLADLAQGLTRRGHDVTLFARDTSFVPNVTIETIAVPGGVRLEPASFAPDIDANATRAADAGFFTQANLFLDLFLQLQQRSAEFDVVHMHAFDWPAYACSPLIRDIPVLHTLHLPAVSSEINAALKALDRRGHPVTLVAVSHACALTYSPYTAIDAMIYNGLELDAIPFSPRPSKEAPLLFAGRIAPEKGVEAAIDIAAMAGYRLLIAGGIYDRLYFEERIAPRLLEAGERVTYLGQLERLALWKIMGQSLGLLFPIEWDEPFGLTAVEAMATGTPVIAYRRGAAEEVIRHGETGYLVEEGERTQAAALVEDLYDIPRVGCRAHVEAHFGMDAMIDAYERVYAEATQFI